MDTCQILGSSKFNYSQLSEQISLKTGGLNVSTHLDDSPFEIEHYEEGILLSSYCLDRNIDAMFDLWEDILINFTKQLNQNERLQTLIKGLASSYANSVVQSGHSFAVMNSSSHHGLVEKLSENLFGLTQVNRMQTIARMDNYESLVEKLHQIATHTLRKISMRCSFNAESDALNTSTKRLETFLEHLPGDQPNKLYKTHFEDASLIIKNDFTLKQEKQQMYKTHFEMPFDVFYSGQTYQAVPYVHEDRPKLSILSKLMFNKYLLREVREIGGAYGGGAYLRGNLFSFFSYRDPHSVETLDKFINCINFIINGHFTEKDVDEAKLATFQKLDAPKSPGNQGMLEFLSGIDDDMRQKNRDRIFTCKKNDLIDVAQRYLKDKVYSATILGPNNPKISLDGTFRQVITSQLPAIGD
ncbi:unnamed protein product [Didymodactylos carnosus]|uniref:Peptidase M16C associated domain-containing protein n=1 Tax=Didymodactylos carnosus TaxID=1234261 RepID=A0A813XV65_9BILA|nr:unnamed protein product [Didymodactylos carnosus]CAF0873524.1 unnamed protein product [Didymodactylos carnosus]CAF3502144.1 unnamed protein product [Didymodactylos carnosus]CAF3660744.1 unnamed protein product [Didymodactylos carnosus]